LFCDLRSRENWLRNAKEVLICRILALVNGELLRFAEL
jgi:hypothetical protein